MRDNYQRTSIVDIATAVAMKQHSRRGFLSTLGKAGLVVVGAAAGIGRATAAFACPPPPPSCSSSCSICNVSCCTGGYCCNESARCQYCQCSCHSVAGGYSLAGINPCTYTFSCSVVPCNNC